METEVLIIGQGISGTMLSYFLHKAGVPHLVLDDARADSATMASAGIINPVTGRRYVQTWMIEEIMPFAVKTYREIGALLNAELVNEKPVIDFFPTVQMRDAFLSRLAENETFLKTYPDQNAFNTHFQYQFGCGLIQPAYVADVKRTVLLWRAYLQHQNQFLQAIFQPEHLKMMASVIEYKNIKARCIIFCDGIQSLQGKWFKTLPFSLNKGEALIITCNALPKNFIYKKGLTLCPLTQENQFWLGSNYVWDFEKVVPTQTFRDYAIQLLRNWLKMEFEVVDHLVALRPATLERRPFAGFHPVEKNIGILNGMGTKGSSLAPYFAHQLTENILHGTALHAEADVQRYSKILSK